MTFAQDETLILFALRDEAQNHFDHLNLVYTGVGKVNAAYHVTRALAAYRARRGVNPALVLNLGSAGSAQFAPGSVVNCTGFVQRDMDLTALGVAPYVTLDDDVPTILRTGLRIDSYPEGTCGSGDHFETRADQSGGQVPWNVVDMESYALAKVCLLENVPFASFKYITDGADGGAADDWQARLDTAARHLHAAMGSCIK